MAAFKPSIAAALICVALCQDQPPSSVRGVSGNSVVLTAADVSTLPQNAIKATDHERETSDLPANAVQIADMT